MTVFRCRVSDLPPDKAELFRGKYLYISHESNLVKEFSELFKEIELSKEQFKERCERDYLKTILTEE